LQNDYVSELRIQSSNSEMPKPVYLKFTSTKIIKFVCLYKVD